MKYPENELLGIDIVIPDFEYLRQNARRIVGVFLTHGHADAIGALPYFVSEFDVPVFGSELTIALAKIACENEEIAKKFNDFHVINEKTEIDFPSATVRFQNDSFDPREPRGRIENRGRNDRIHW